MAKCKGCGPGGIGDVLVPDTMWGLDVSEACRIHDFEFRFCKDRSKKAFKAANKRLLQNGLIIVKLKSNRWYFKRMRIIRCYTYYYFVKAFGKFSWDNEISFQKKY